MLDPELLDLVHAATNWFRASLVMMCFMAFGLGLGALQFVAAFRRNRRYRRELEAVRADPRKTYNRVVSGLNTGGVRPDVCNECGCTDGPTVSHYAGCSRL